MRERKWVYYIQMREGDVDTRMDTSRRWMWADEIEDVRHPTNNEREKKREDSFFWIIIYDFSDKKWILVVIRFRFNFWVEGFLLFSFLFSL
jgi:hypothetical protein